MESIQKHNILNVEKQYAVYVFDYNNSIDFLFEYFTSIQISNLSF